jgi:WD40 repeat protein
MIREIDIGANMIRSMTFSPDGALLAISTEQHGILVASVPDGTIRYQLSNQMSFASEAAFSPDGTVLAGGGTFPDIPFWNMSDGTLARSIATGCGEVFELEFSHDGQLLLNACNSGDTTVRRASDGAVVASVPLSDPSTPVGSLSFSPDDQYFATSYVGGNVTIWSTSAASRVLDIAAPSCDKVEFSPDGRFVATHQNMSTIEIFDALSGSSVETLATSANDMVWAGTDRLVTMAVVSSFQVWTGQPGSLHKACETRAEPMYFALAAFGPGNLAAVPSRVESGSTYVGIYSILP